MQTWLLFLLLAAVFAVIGVIQFRLRQTSEKRVLTTKALTPRIVEGEQAMRTAVVVPAVWNERAVLDQLTRFQSQPEILASYVNALKARFILKVEDGTAQARTRFLRTHIGELQLAKEYKTLIQDLSAMEAEQENRLLRLELEREELRAKQHQAEALGSLQLKRDRLAIEVEIAELKAKKETINKPPLPEIKVSPEQRRAQEKLGCEAHMAELKAQRNEALKIADEEERVRKVNALDAALEREHERWGRLL